MHNCSEVKFKGLVKNRPISELTHQELTKAFSSTKYKLTNHAIKRLKDPRTKGLRFETLNDISKIFNKGVKANERDGLISFSCNGMVAIINPKTNIIVTFTPTK